MTVAVFEPILKFWLVVIRPTHFEQLISLSVKWSFAALAEVRRMSADWTIGSV